MHQKEIVLGGFGQILLALGNILILVISAYSPRYTDFINLNSLNAAVLVISFALILISMIGVYEINRHNALGEVGAAFGILFAVIYALLFLGAPLQDYYSREYTYVYISEQEFFPSSIGFLMLDICYVLYGIAALYIGAFYVTHRGLYSRSRLWATAGATYMIAGVLSISIILVYLTYILSLVAGIIGATCFLASKPK
jgi:hypothetical protein